MEKIKICSRQQQRRGKAARWAAQNPVLLEGEIGIETDTRRFKIGDGVTAWNALAYGGEYDLPPASGSTLGGIMAAARGSRDTVEVRIDATTHRLFVPAYPEAGQAGIPFAAISDFNTAPVNTLFYADRALNAPPAEGCSTQVFGITIADPATPEVFVQLAVPKSQTEPWGCGPLFVRASYSPGPDRWSTGWYCIGQYEPNKTAALVPSLASHFGGKSLYRCYITGTAQVSLLASVRLKDYAELAAKGTWRLCGVKGVVRFIYDGVEEFALTLPFNQYPYGTTSYRVALYDKQNVTWLDIAAPSGKTYTAQYHVLLEYGKV